MIHQERFIVTKLWQILMCRAYIWAGGRIWAYLKAAFEAPFGGGLSFDAKKEL
jgi:hypothetical protein